MGIPQSIIIVRPLARGLSAVLPAGIGRNANGDRSCSDMSSPRLIDSNATCDVAKGRSVSSGTVGGSENRAIIPRSDVEMLNVHLWFPVFDDRVIRSGR
jgi:hypothetical protein